MSGTLTDAVTNAPIANEPVTLTLNGMRRARSTPTPAASASCPITPGEAAGTYTLTGSFAGDTTLPLQLTAAVDTPANFTVTPAPTSLTYTGATATFNGQSVTLSGAAHQRRRPGGRGRR